MCVSRTALILCLLTTSCFASGFTAIEEKPDLIEISNAPAAPPESAEARIALRQHREATTLNRFTFRGNVLEGTGDIVDDWIVMFCPGWHDKCQGLLPSYELLGLQWENKLNKGIMSSKVRFAKVDCATDKALCVSLDVDDYPSVVHYRSQQRAGSWHGGAPGLVRFVKQELEGPKRRPSRGAAEKKAVKSFPTCAANGPSPEDSVEENTNHWVICRAACLALILIAATRSAWMLFNKRRGLVLETVTKQDSALASKPMKVQRATSLNASLPDEWARERRAIVL